MVLKDFLMVLKYHKISRRRREIFEVLGSLRMIFLLKIERKSHIMHIKHENFRLRRANIISFYQFLLKPLGT